MANVILDIETSIAFHEARDITGNKYLNIPVIASFPWLAVTDTDGVVREWNHQDAPALLHYLAQRHVVGWNILEFDLPIVQIAAKFQGAEWDRIEDYTDIFEKARAITKSKQSPSGIWYSLESVTIANNLGSKSRNSSLIPELFETDRQVVIDHCRRDVELEKAVYQLAQTSGLVFPEHTDHKTGVYTESWTLKL